MKEHFNKNILKELDYYSGIKHNNRSSARILDSFPLTYKHISQSSLESIKKHYLLFPTAERKPAPREGEGSHQGQGIHKALCADLSGIGLKIITEQRLRGGDFIEFTIAPPMAKPRLAIQIVGEVKRVSIADTEGGTSCCAGLFFYAINESDREALTHYTFEIQLRLLRMKRQIKDYPEY